MKKQCRGRVSEKGGQGQLQIEGGLGKKEGVLLLRGVSYPNAQCML